MQPNGLAKQHSAGVRSNPSAVEPSDDLASSECVRLKLSWCALRIYGTSLSGECKLLIQNTLPDNQRTHGYAVAIPGRVWLSS